MEKMKIIFWKESYNHADTFVQEINNFLTTADVTKTELNDDVSYHIKFEDIGLDSLYGELDIIRRNGFWVTSTEDSTELNLLKWNIIGALMLQPY